MTTAALPTADEALAWLCAADLREFQREAWPLLEPAQPMVESWHQATICEHLQAVSDGEILRLIINQPPRTGKSIGVSVMWPAWEWLRKPYLRWLFASYAEAFAQRDSVKMRRLIRSQGGREDGTLLQRVGYQGLLALLGESWTLTEDQDAKGKYETTASGMRFATGVGGMATGEGGDRVVVDDPTNAKQAQSEALRTAANDWWDGTMSTRFNNADAASVIVMQRLHEDDLTGHLLAEQGDRWHHLCLPAEYEPSHQFVYPAEVELPSGRVLQGDVRTEEGESIDGVRLGDDKRAELKQSLGTYGWEGQFQQRPAPKGGGMFKDHWWKRWEPGFEARLQHEGLELVQSWDFAFKNTKDSDFVVGQLWGFHGADAYLLAQVRGRLSFTESQDAMRALTAYAAETGTGARRGSAKLVEEKANGAAIIETLRREVGSIIAVSPKESKEARASAVTPRVEAGNVYLPPGKLIPCPESWTNAQGVTTRFEATAVDAFKHEHGRFPKGANDDQVDALTQALAWRRPASLAAPSAGPKRAPARGIFPRDLRTRAI